MATRYGVRWVSRKDQGKWFKRGFAFAEGALELWRQKVEEEANGPDVLRATLEYFGPNGERGEDWMKHGIGKKTVLQSDAGRDTLPDIVACRPKDGAQEELWPTVEER